MIEHLRTCMQNVSFAPNQAKCSFGGGGMPESRFPEQNKLICLIIQANQGIPDMPNTSKIKCVFAKVRTYAKAKDVVNLTSKW